MIRSKRFVFASAATVIAISIGAPLWWLCASSPLPRTNAIPQSETPFIDSLAPNHPAIPESDRAVTKAGRVLKSKIGELGADLTKNATDAGNAPANNQPAGEWEPGQVMVEFRQDSNVTEAEVLAKFKWLGALTALEIASNMFLVTFDEKADIPELVKRVKKQPGVDSAHGSPIFRTEG
jgi:hypothetical protein